MIGLIAGAIAGLGVSALQIEQSSSTSQAMKEQTEKNLSLANKQADFYQENWNNYEKPAMIRQQILERDAQSAQFSSSGILNNIGSALSARSYLRMNQNLELNAREKEVQQEVYITRESGQLQYKEGLLQARINRLNGIFGAITGGTSAITAGGIFGVGKPRNSRN